jgi:putative transposase
MPVYRTIPIRAKFSTEESLFWEDQCRHSNSLINCAIYYTRQTHYETLKEKGNAFTTYWREDFIHTGWKTWNCSVTYPELCRELKENEHYKALAAQAAQQTLKGVGESVTSYNGLVKLYYENPRKNPRPSLPKYRTKGGLAAVTFPRQALTYCEGVFYPSISRETKPEMITVIGLQPPEFIDPDWVKEVTVRPKLGEFWIDWVIDDGKTPVSAGQNPNLDYTHAWSFDRWSAIYAPTTVVLIG